MPQWNIPEAFANFRIPDYKKAALDRLPANILRMERNLVQDRLESIMDLSYYARPSLGFPGQWVTYLNPNKDKRYYYDMGENYALLFYIDTLLERLEPIS